MTSRKGFVYVFNTLAGTIKETEDGQYIFSYTEKYLNSKEKYPVSLTLPLRKEAYVSKILFPFFDGLIPEGWLLQLSTKNWKLDPRDRMGLLLTTCEDCIGSVHILQNDEGSKKHD